MATDGAPPAYNSLQDGAADAPPAYAGTGGAQAAPVAYPQLQGNPQGVGAVPVQGMAMTQMLSNPNAAAMQPQAQVQGQPVIYMMQQPDGSMVQLQGVAPVQGQPMMFQAQGAQVGQVAAQPVQMQAMAMGPGATNAAGTAASTVNAGGEGAPVPVAVVVPGAAQVGPSGFVLEAYYNTRALSWGLFFLWAFYILQLYASIANVLTIYDYDDTTVEFSTDEVTTTDSYYVLSWYDDDDYADLCDAGSDTYCELEDRGTTFLAVRNIAHVVGVIAAILFSNILAKCCCNDAKNVKNELNVIKGAVWILVALSIVLMCVWEAGNPLYDDCDDCEWGVSIWMTFFNIFGYFSVLIFIYQKKK